jgi:predicted transcriptional regulator
MYYSDPAIRLNTETKKRLEALAQRSKRSKSFLAAEAIAQYVEAESGSSARSGQGLLISTRAGP